jgi:hypothetical protein
LFYVSSDGGEETRSEMKTARYIDKYNPGGLINKSRVAHQNFDGLACPILESLLFSPPEAKVLFDTIIFT